MTAATPLRHPITRIACYYRPILLTVTVLVILCVFWFASRYPQLLTKASHVGQALPSMAYSSEVLPVTSRPI